MYKCQNTLYEGLASVFSTIASLSQRTYYQCLWRCLQLNNIVYLLIRNIAQVNHFYVYFSVCNSVQGKRQMLQRQNCCRKEGKDRVNMGWLEVPHTYTYSRVCGIFQDNTEKMFVRWVKDQTTFQSLRWVNDLIHIWIFTWYIIFLCNYLCGFLNFTL